MDGLMAGLDYSNQTKANEQISKYAELKNKLEEVMKLWEEAGNQLSAFQ